MSPIHPLLSSVPDSSGNLLAMINLDRSLISKLEDPNPDRQIDEDRAGKTE
jgi:hypothetical protein